MALFESNPHEMSEVMQKRIDSLTSLLAERNSLIEELSTGFERIIVNADGPYKILSLIASENIALREKEGLLIRERDRLKNELALAVRKHDDSMRLLNFYVMETCKLHNEIADLNLEITEINGQEQ
jgi:hypothetical protein